MIQCIKYFNFNHIFVFSSKKKSYRALHLIVWKKFDYSIFGRINVVWKKTEMHSKFITNRATYKHKQKNASC